MLDMKYIWPAVPAVCFAKQSARAGEDAKKHKVHLLLHHFNALLFHPARPSPCCSYACSGEQNKDRHTSQLRLIQRGIDRSVLAVILYIL